MTNRIRLDDLNSDQLDQLYDQLERAETELQQWAAADSADAAAGSYAHRAEHAEAELARLRAGEEDGYNPHTMPTPGQWIWVWNRATTEERHRIVTAFLDDAATASRCRFDGHLQRLEEDRHAWVALARIRDVIADMEQITGARHWARILRKAVDGDEPAPAGPVVARPRACRYCPDPACPEDCPECGGPIHDLDAVPSGKPLVDRPFRSLRQTPGMAAAQAAESVQQTDADPDDPPVQCWHTEPDTPCDWDVCKQPERLAVGDYGTDPREQH